MHLFVLSLQPNLNSLNLKEEYCVLGTRFGEFVGKMSDMSDEEEQEVTSLTKAQLASARQLINFVRERQALWNTKSQEYKKAKDKHIMWDVIGAHMNTPIDGTEAKAQFKNLRTTYVRLNKKVKASEPRSGAGSNETPYVPDWPLFTDMTFLEDVIRPRKTASSSLVRPCKKGFEFKEPAAKKSKKAATEPVVTVPLLQEALSSAMSETWSYDLGCTIPSGDEEDSNSSSGAGSSFVSPKPDKSYTNKKETEGNFMQSMIKVAGSLSTALEKKSTNAPSSTTVSSNSAYSLEVENWGSIFKMYLAKVPPKQMHECAAKVLAVMTTFTDQDE